MSFVNYNSKEINCKVVYFGPPGSGKTANLQHIYAQTSAEERGQLISVPPANEHTLFYDFLPLAVGSLRGYKVRFHLYTIPGQNNYDASRRLILRGVDGIVFVSDSLVTRMEDNLESYRSLVKNLEEQGYEVAKIPIVYQYNKRDLPNVSPVAEMAKILNPQGAAEFEAVATSGDGVLETLRALTKIILAELKG